jgi:hypothetical protein
MPPVIHIILVPAGVTVLLGLHNPPCSWTGTVGPSLPGFTIAPCVDSLLCYRIDQVDFKIVLKSKVLICILHIYILVVSLLPRLGEPLAHSLELWFLHMCVHYLPTT